MESTTPMKHTQLDALIEDDASTSELSAQDLRAALAGTGHAALALADLDADAARTGQIQRGQLNQLLQAHEEAKEHPAGDHTEEIDRDILQRLTQTAPAATKQPSREEIMATIKIDLPNFIEQDRKVEQPILLVNKVKPPMTEKLAAIILDQPSNLKESTTQIDVNQIIEALPAESQQAETHDEQEAFLAMMGMSDASQRHMATPRPITPDPQRQKEALLREAMNHRPVKKTLHVIDPGPSLPPIIAPVAPIAPNTTRAGASRQVYLLMGTASVLFVGILAMLLKLFVFVG